ncbi:MAG TPA: zinc-binding dehydrogenase [Bacteroidota bacterium]|nr:zinc-binding dehydrogenase [Bacteroidota bacterium]
MKAAVVTRFGPPDVLQIQDLPKPVPGENDVLVKVKSIGLNFADVMARLGVYPAIPDPPFVPGIELAGTVEAMGNGVHGVKKGERVWAFSKQGAYAEYVCVPAPSAIPIPKGVDFSHAVALGVTYLTAYHALVTLANVKKKERVLIHAAAGGVGTAAIQIAKHLKTEVFATVGSAEKMEVARTQGADVVINYSTQKFADVIRMETDGTGVDVILDSVGGRVMKEGWKLLAPMGRYVLFGFAAVTGTKRLNRVEAAREAISVPIIYPPSILSRNVGLFAFNLYFLSHKVEYLRSAWKTIADWNARGVIKPVIGMTFPFERIAEAQAFLQSRKSTGKVVVHL